MLNTDYKCIEGSPDTVFSLKNVELLMSREKDMQMKQSLHTVSVKIDLVLI